MSSRALEGGGLGAPRASVVAFRPLRISSGAAGAAALPGSDAACPAPSSVSRAIVIIGSG